MTIDTIDNQSEVTIVSCYVIVYPFSIDFDMFVARWRLKGHTEKYTFLLRLIPVPTLPRSRYTALILFALGSNRRI